MNTITCNHIDQKTIRLVGTVDPDLIVMDNGVLWFLMNSKTEYVESDGLSFGHVVDEGIETVASYRDGHGVAADQAIHAASRLRDLRSILYPTNRYMPPVSEWIDGGEEAELPADATLLHTTETGQEIYQSDSYYYIRYPAEGQYDEFVEIVVASDEHPGPAEEAVRSAIAYDIHRRSARVELKICESTLKEMHQFLMAADDETHVQ